MKMSRIAATLSGTALLFASAAIAGELSKATIHLDQRVSVEGKTLDSGKYTAQWDGTGPTVQVTLLRGKNPVATFQAHLNNEPAGNPQDAIGTTASPDGSRALAAIYPGGKRFSLQLESNSAEQQSNSAPAR
jgi:hypothetical protein